MSFFRILADMLEIRAAEWDLGNPIWTGRLVIRSKGERCIIALEDPNTNEVFAVCPYSDPAVETVNDSSRYFVLRIEDGQRHAFIGIGFAERNEAFDFNAALADHKKYVKQMKEAEQNLKKLESMPHQNYSLAEGQTIRVNIPNAKAGSTAKRTTSSSSSSGGLGILPPPPSASSSRSVPAPVSPAPKTVADPFASFGFSSAPAAPAQTTSSSLDDLWSDFTGSSQAQPQQQQSAFNAFPSSNFGGWSDPFQ